MMEKITITSLIANPTMAGKQRWKVLDDMNREFGVWDEDLADFIMKNLNKLAYVSIKVSGNYNNIVSFEPITGEVAHAVEKVNEIMHKAIDVNAPTKPFLSAMEEKNLSIISQVMVKCANEYACMIMSDTAVDTATSKMYGEVLGDAINELTGAYHLAFNNLQTGENYKVTIKNTKI